MAVKLTDPAPTHSLAAPVAPSSARDMGPVFPPTYLALPQGPGWVARICGPEGTMQPQTGDYLVSDDPPTHLWPVRREVFERTYEPES